MKKSLLGLLLAVAMVVPAFAQKGDMSVNAKLGLGVNSYVSVSENDVVQGFKVDTPFMIGAEFFYGLLDNLSLGLGANYFFDTPAKVDSDAKYGTTNIYATVKPEFKVEAAPFSSVYLIGQIGLSMVRSKSDAPGAKSVDIDPGIYLGAGFGTMIKDALFVELIFSTCNGKVKESHLENDIDVQYTVTQLNIGYKFNI